MGDQLTEEPSEVKKSFTQQFYEALPFFLSIGMTYDEFYNKDVYLTRAYLKAEQEKRKQKNFDAWLQGAYVYEAFSKVQYNVNRGKSDPPKEYTNKPYDIYGEQSKVDQENKVKEAKAQAMYWMYSLVQNYKKKER